MTGPWALRLGGGGARAPRAPWSRRLCNCPCFFVDNKQELNDFMKKELDENTNLQLRSCSSRAKKSRSDDSCDEASYLIFFQL